MEKSIVSIIHFSVRMTQKGVQYYRNTHFELLSKNTKVLMSTPVIEMCHQNIFLVAIYFNIILIFQITILKHLLY